MAAVLGVDDAVIVRELQDAIVPDRNPFAKQAAIQLHQLGDLAALQIDHAQRLSIAFHDSRGTAETIYRIQWDALSIQHIAVNGVIPFITSLITVVSMIAVTARIDLTLALIALVVAPALYLLTLGYRRPLRRRYAAVKGMETSALAVVQEVLVATLGELALRGSPGAAFLIGGAFGLDRTLLRDATHRVSLSPMTMPHDLARLVLAEQLYRAGTIVRGEPYHKG